MVRSLSSTNGMNDLRSVYQGHIIHIPFIQKVRRLFLLQYTSFKVYQDCSIKVNGQGEYG